MCHDLLLFCRFEFDMSVEDAQRRELSVCVKNASSSFMNRDKDVIGQVSLPGLSSAGQNILQNKPKQVLIRLKYLDFLTLTNMCTKLCKIIRLVFIEFILNYELHFVFNF